MVQRFKFDERLCEYACRLLAELTSKDAETETENDPNVVPKLRHQLKQFTIAGKLLREIKEMHLGGYVNARADEAARNLRL
jgi:hypothetical protein